MMMAAMETVSSLGSSSSSFTRFTHTQTRRYRFLLFVAGVRIRRSRIIPLIGAARHRRCNHLRRQTSSFMASLAKEGTSDDELIVKFDS